jgi:hypothetical protein
MAATQKTVNVLKGKDAEVNNASVAGFLYESSKNAITAFAGGGQASATALTALLNRVTTVASANDSVKLPASEVGLTIELKNAAAANSLNLFPITGEIINALAANAAFAVAAGKSVWATCHVLGTWDITLSA